MARQLLLNSFILYLLGCKDPNKCECKLKLTNLGYSHVTDLVLGQNENLHVRFKVTNSGKEPAIGTYFKFAFPVDLPLNGDDQFHCKKEFTDYEACGQGGEVDVRR